MERRLKEMGFTVSDKETPADGSCLFHALLDQIQSNPSVPLFAESHWELRYKIVCEGYEQFLVTDKVPWPNECSIKEWKMKMLNQNEWGDEVVLVLASNILQVDIHVIPAFRESSCNHSGIIIVKSSSDTSNKQPLFLFHFSDSDFSPAHYQSIKPSLPASLPPEIAVTEVINFHDQQDQLVSEFELTEESIRNVQIVITDDQPSRYEWNVNFCYN